MKCLALIGTLKASGVEIYWKTIQQEAGKKLGANRMPNLLVHCDKTGVLAERLNNNDWPAVADYLIDAGRRMMTCGADCLVICGSGLNPVAAEVQRTLNVPVIDLGYTVLIKLQSLGHRCVAVLGIRTPQEEFMWTQKLAGVTLLQPEARDREWLTGCVDAILSGQPFVPDWKITTQRMVSALRKNGAQAIVLAEPTLGRWIKPGESVLYPVDAVEIHAWIAALWALESRLLPTPACLIA